MPLFTKNRKIAVQSFILKVVNNNCPELAALIEGPRLDHRVNLTVVVLVIPVKDDQILTERAFTAVTKEFSVNGVGLVLNQPMGLDEVVLGFRWQREMIFARAVAKHLNPLGGGFYQLGLSITEMLHAGDHPELVDVLLTPPPGLALEAPCGFALRRFAPRQFGDSLWLGLLPTDRPPTRLRIDTPLFLSGRLP